MLKKGLVLSFLASVLLFADALPLAHMATLPGKPDKAFEKVMEEKIGTVGFKITDEHKRVNDQYEKKYGSTNLEILSFMPVVNDTLILPLLNKDPRIAGFAPFNMLIYRKKGETVTHIGHLSAKMMLEILGIEDKEIRSKYIDGVAKLDTLLSKELNASFEDLPYKKLPETRMMTFVYEFKKPENMEDFLDEFQEKFEDAFVDAGYLIAGYHNFMEASDDAPKILKGFDAFWTYSLCHLQFSYGVFDTTPPRPDAGLFAPCTLYAYIKKGSNRIVMGMYRLHNWSDTLGIKNAKKMALIDKLDREIPAIMTKLGMKHATNAPDPKVIEAPEAKSAVQPHTPTPIKNHVAPASVQKPKTQRIEAGEEIIDITIPVPPKPPKAPKLHVHYEGKEVQQSTENNIGLQTNRAIRFSKRTPPGYIPPEKRQTKAEEANDNSPAGEIANGRLSLYLRGAYRDAEAVKKALESQGFKVIAQVPVDKKGMLVVTIFSDDTADKEGSDFAKEWRILSNGIDKTIAVQNPLFIAKAYEGKEANLDEARKCLKRLRNAFGDLSNGKDKLKVTRLANYRFMKGMPGYGDMVTLAQGGNLLKKAEGKKSVAYRHTLANGDTIIGINFSRRTQKFVKKIGVQNAALLPYPILVTKDKAVMLDPKYYIALMYPSLQMSQFMAIATIPGAIVEEAKRLFK